MFTTHAKTAAALAATTNNALAVVNSELPVVRHQFRDAAKLLCFNEAFRETLACGHRGTFLQPTEGDLESQSFNRCIAYSNCIACYGEINEQR